jgi:hypothetical protein
VNFAKTWVVTTDGLLPGATPQCSDATTLAIGLEALLQWFSPLLLPETTNGEFPAAFAEMIRRRLLPQERFFEPEDFLIFHVLNMACKDLPADDVEQCVRYIKTNAAHLDPSVPADREKLAY